MVAIISLSYTYPLRMISLEIEHSDNIHNLFRQCQRQIANLEGIRGVSQGDFISFPQERKTYRLVANGEWELQNRYEVL